MVFRSEVRAGVSSLCGCTTDVPVCLFGLIFGSGGPRSSFVCSTEHMRHVYMLHVFTHV